MAKKFLVLQMRFFKLLTSLLIIKMFINFCLKKRRFGDAAQRRRFNEGVRELILIKINDAFEWKEGEVNVNLSKAINCAGI